MTSTPELPPWLEAMPPAHCPEGCVVRKGLGNLLGVVTRAEEGRWSVTMLGYSTYRESGRSTGPEANGWRHALDHRSGLAYVLQEVSTWRHRNAGYPDNIAPIDALVRWGEVWGRFSINENNDTDRLQLARAYAAVSR